MPRIFAFSVARGGVFSLSRCRAQSLLALLAPAAAVAASDEEKRRRRERALVSVSLPLSVCALSL